MKMSKYLFKKFVRESCKKQTVKYLLQEKETLSKLENTSYQVLELQKYLKSKTISKRQKKDFIQIKN